MMSGAHVMIFTRDKAADRAFLRGVLEIPCIDLGDGTIGLYQASRARP